MYFAAPPRTARLAPYVASIGYYESALPAGRDRVLPGGGAGLMVNLHEDEFRTYHGPAAGQVRRSPGAVLTGAEDRAVVIDAADQRRGLSVEFTPGGAAAFFGLPLGEATGQLIGLAGLWGRDGAGPRCWGTYGSATWPGRPRTDRPSGTPRPSWPGAAGSATWAGNWG